METLRIVLIIIFWLLAISVMITLLIWDIKSAKINKKNNEKFSREIDLQIEVLLKQLEQLEKNTKQLEKEAIKMEKTTKKKVGRPKKEGK